MIKINQEKTQSNKEGMYMGKGDMRTKRGKIFGGSYGAKRPRKKKKKSEKKD
jgi:ribosomal small subunit protein bTHX